MKRPAAALSLSLRMNESLRCSVKKSRTPALRVDWGGVEQHRRPLRHSTRAHARPMTKALHQRNVGLRPVCGCVNTWEALTQTEIHADLFIWHRVHLQKESFTAWASWAFHRCYNSSSLKSSSIQCHSTRAPVRTHLPIQVSFYYVKLHRSQVCSGVLVVLS